MTETFPLPRLTVFTTAEVARILKVCGSTVRNLKKKGELEALPGMRVNRFPEYTVLAYLNRKKH